VARSHRYVSHKDLEKQEAWLELRAWLPFLAPFIVTVILVGLLLIAASLLVLKTVFLALNTILPPIIEPIASLVSPSSLGLLLASSLLGSLISYLAGRKKRGADIGRLFK